MTTEEESHSENERVESVKSPLKKKEKSGKKMPAVFPVIREPEDEEEDDETLIRARAKFPHSESEDIPLPEGYKPTKYDVIK